MKLRYKIILTHFILYAIAYYFSIFYFRFTYNSCDDAWDAIAFAFDLITGWIVSAALLTIIPIIGVLIGKVKKNKELQLGCFIATLSAVVIDIVIILGFHYNWPFYSFGTFL